MFNSVEAAVAATALGNIRFKCPVCGARHNSKSRAWRKCLKAKYKHLDQNHKHTIFGDYTETWEKKTIIRLPYITVRFPDPIDWKAFAYPEDADMYFARLDDMEENKIMLADKYDALVEQFSIKPAIPLELMVKKRDIEKYITENVDAYKNHLKDWAEHIINYVEKLYTRYVHLFTLSPPSTHINMVKLSPEWSYGKESPRWSKKLFSSMDSPAKTKVEIGSYITKKTTNRITLQSYGEYPIERNKLFIVANRCDSNSPFVESIMEEFTPIIQQAPLTIPTEVQIR